MPNPDLDLIAQALVIISYHLDTHPERRPPLNRHDTPTTQQSC